MINYKTIWFSNKEIIKNSYFMLIPSSFNTFELLYGIHYLVEMDREKEHLDEEYISYALTVVKEARFYPEGLLIYVCRVIEQEKFGIIITDKNLRKLTVEESNLINRKHPEMYPFVYPDIKVLRRL